MSAVSAGISEVLIKYTGKYVKIYFIMKLTYIWIDRVHIHNLDLQITSLTEIQLLNTFSCRIMAAATSAGDDFQSAQIFDAIKGALDDDGANLVKKVRMDFALLTILFVYLWFHQFSFLLTITLAINHDEYDIGKCIRRYW